MYINIYTYINKYTYILSIPTQYIEYKYICMQDVELTTDVERISCGWVYPKVFPKVSWIKGGTGRAEHGQKTAMSSAGREWSTLW